MSEGLKYLIRRQLPRICGVFLLFALLFPLMPMPAKASDITFIGANSATGTTVTLPEHQPGDIIIIISWRSSGSSSPTEPSPSETVPIWNSPRWSNGSNWSVKTSWARASSSNHTSGTWTNASGLTALVYRGAQSVGSAIGGDNVVRSAHQTTCGYPSLDVSRTDGSSLALRIMARRTADNEMGDNLPTGFTLRSEYPADTPNVVVSELNGPLDDLDEETVTCSDGAFSIAYVGFSIELLAEPSEATQISTCEELQAIENDYSGYYELANDIDCSDTVNWNDGAGFIPITEFNGFFDGKGFVISDLYINSDSEDVGLFDWVGMPGIGVLIKNVGLENVNINATDEWQVGALIGYFWSGTVSNSYATGVINATDGAVGGLIGFADYDDNAGYASANLVENSYANVEINCSAYCYPGGFIGYGYGTVRNSYAIGEINATTSSFGGGFASDANGRFYDSFAAGPVNMMDVDWYIGGFSGTSEAFTGSGSGEPSEATGIYYDVTRTGQPYCHTSGYEEEEEHCTEINADGNQPNYFFNPENEPFTSWDTEDVWYFSGSDFPTLFIFCDPGECEGSGDGGGGEEDPGEGEGDDEGEDGDGGEGEDSEDGDSGNSGSENIVRRSKGTSMFGRIVNILNSGNFEYANVVMLNNPELRSQLIEFIGYQLQGLMTKLQGVSGN